ncbi:hypothetical protein AVEN_201149-1 [Araneus ventricosus]|uniref:Tc1-like transposase DDE domain-containing protein n=1 Tax=Araneus ventricosus TaxID=182803 RepID=A0A4Y2FIJ7_ARAVE|nr:hypothetical protein AVEN_201149-1 [Araneus ventricosus]
MRFLNVNVALPRSCWLRFYVMDDNARSHRALLVDDFLEEECIRCMVWQASSPDHNPTDNTWEALEGHLNHVFPSQDFSGLKTHC